MRILLLCWFLLGNLYWANAQINVGSNMIPKLAAGKISPETYADIQSAQAYFLLRDADQRDSAVIAGILAEAWTLCPVAVIPHAAACDLPEDGNYLFMDIDRSTRNYVQNSRPPLAMGDAQYDRLNQARHRASRQRGVKPMIHFHLWLRGEAVAYKNWELRAMKGDEEPPTRYEKRTIARVDMHAINLLGTTPSTFNNQGNHDINCGKSLFNRSGFSNWEPGFLKNYLQEIVRNVENQETRFLYQEKRNEGELGQLQSQTLYVPNYAMKVIQPIMVRRHRPEDLMDDYEHPYELISGDALSQKILLNEEPFFYLSCIRNLKGTAFYNVVNSATGQIIYSDFEHKRLNFERNDVRRLSNAIGRLWGSLYVLADLK